MKKLLVLLLALVMVLSLAACGSDEKAAEDEETKEVQNDDKKPSSSKDDEKDDEDEDSIIGIWLNEDIEIAYEFKKNGEVVLYELGYDSETAEYEYSDGVLVLYDKDEEFELTVEFDGDTLLLSDGSDEVELERVDDLDDYIEDDEDDEDDEDASILGSWTGAMDMAGVFNMSLTSLVPEDALDYLEAASLEFIYTYEFFDDGEYSVSLDIDALADELEDYVDDLLDGFEEYFEELIDAEGLDMDVDEYLEDYMGTSMDDLEKSFEESFDVDSLSGGMDNTTGEYEIDGDELYLSAENCTYVFEVDGDELIFYSFADDMGVDGADELYESVFPIVFERD